jgi:hypothetical protein
VLFAFVDLAVWSDNQVVTYLVPSPKVTEFCALWVDKVSMVRLHAPVE